LGSEESEGKEKAELSCLWEYCSLIHSLIAKIDF
jgi:hypothetical protein